MRSQIRSKKGEACEEMEFVHKFLFLFDNISVDNIVKIEISILDNKKVSENTERRTMKTRKRVS